MSKYQPLSKEEIADAYRDRKFYESFGMELVERIFATIEARDKRIAELEKRLVEALNDLLAKGE